MINVTIDTAAAQKYFSNTDKVMSGLLYDLMNSNNGHSIPKPLPKTKYFNSIVKSIVSQQISTKAASSINKRVSDLLIDVTPQSAMAIDFDDLKACGLSTQKTSYIKRSAEMWGEIPFGNFTQMKDEEIVQELTKLPGIGRWTAEMFLMFSMARPDVFSYGDLGLMQSLYRNYNYRPHYARKIRTTVESWSPHRTLASLALWHHKDNGPGVW